MAAGRHHQGVVGQGVAREDVAGLGHQVAPGRRLRPGRVGDRDPEPGRVQVGVEVQAAVGPDPAVGLGVDPLLDRPQGPVAGQVGDVQVVAGRRPGRRPDQQPAAVERHPERVVLGLLPPLPEDQLVAVGVGPDPVAPDPPVERGLALGDRVGGQSPPVVVGVAAGQPGQRAVAGAVDRPLDRLAGGHVHDEQGGLLVAALGQEVGQPLALQRRHPAVEGDGVVVGQGARVDQDPLGPVGLPHQQHRMLLVAAAALEEPAVAPEHRHRDQPGPEQPLQPFPHRLPLGPLVHPPGQQLVLGLAPRLGLVGLGILQPPVGVGDPVAVQLLDQVEPSCGRVAHR